MANWKAGSILILPSGSYEIGSSAKKPKTPKKTVAHVCGTPGTDDIGGSSHDPRNFLVRGGTRAIEQKLIGMNKSAMQELRNTNAVLAEELVKARTGSEQIRDQLREKELSIETMHVTIERLEKARKLLDKKHLLQLKEMNRRYKDEQAHRLALEVECAHLRASKDVVDHQTDSLQEERAQLMDLVNSQRSNSSRLEATVAADAATIAELRARVQTAEARLADELTARQELFARHKAMEADLKLAMERHSSLTGSSSEAEARVRAAVSRVQLLEDELADVKRALQAEKAAFSAERHRATSLQSELTQLQTSSQLAAAASASERGELERLRAQVEQLMTANDALRADVSRLGEEGMHLTSQQAVFKASCKDLQQQRDQLQQQLSAATEMAEKLERRLREEEAARQRSHLEALEAKQRQWEEKQRSREKAWEEDLTRMKRSHEEDLTLKDLELLELRERMREAQSSVTELAGEVANFRFQGQQYTEAFREVQELKMRLTQAEEDVAKRDASLAEAAASHAAQLELWKAEANEVAHAAAKWKQRCTTLQSQAEARESELDAAEVELQSLSSRLSTSEAERLKVQEDLASAESRLALMEQDSKSYRAQLSEVLASNQAVARQLEAAHQDLQMRNLQIGKLNQNLNEEVTRSNQLRQEVTTAAAQHAKELDAKRHTLDTLTEQLHEAEQARASALVDTDRLRDRVALLTREVGRARMAADAVRSAATNAAAGLRQSADISAGSNGWGGHTARNTGRVASAGAATRPPPEYLSLEMDSAAVNRGAFLRRSGGDVGGSGVAAAAAAASTARPLPDHFDIAVEDELDRRLYGHRGGVAMRRDIAVSFAQDDEETEEEDSWFRSLLEEEERRQRERPTGREGEQQSGCAAATAAVAATPRRDDIPHEPPRCAAVTSTPPPPPAQHHLHHPHHHDLQQQQHSGLQTTRADARSPVDVTPGAGVQTFDVLISQQQLDAARGAEAGAEHAVQGLQPPTYRQRQVETHPATSASSVALSPERVAAIAAAAYTAMVTPLEQAAARYGSQLAASTLHAAPAATQQQRTVSVAASPNPTSSSIRYSLNAQRQPQRPYGSVLSHQQQQQQQPPFPYTRSNAVARTYSASAVIPFSPAVSESASTASSNLQERLQRLLGTWKLS